MPTNVSDISLPTKYRLFKNGIYVAILISCTYAVVVFAFNFTEQNLAWTST